MKTYRLTAFVLLASLAILACAEAETETDWRKPDPGNLLYMTLPDGIVVMELAPEFAPNNVANIKTLVKENYFDGLAVIRSQDNYVVQWGDPTEEENAIRPLGSAAETVAPEFVRNVDGLVITEIDSRDAYAETVGFADGFPIGADGQRAWLTHCYGMVGVARGTQPNSGNGSSLYVITGHAPRHLDRNITLAGRVLTGIENLTTLPRGNGPLGFYESADETAPIVSVRLGSDIVEANRINIEVMRTDSSAFVEYVSSRTHRNEEWFVDPTGRIEICNIHPPVRIAG